MCVFNAALSPSIILAHNGQGFCSFLFDELEFKVLFFEVGPLDFVFEEASALGLILLTQRC